jgi:predicted transposase/invertase (TIGR01784 family)
VNREDEEGMRDAHVSEDNSDVQERFSYDDFYKDLIEKFLYSLLERAIPELYEKADITKKARFLDKEFRDILNTGDAAIHTSPHFADCVLEVPLKNKDVTWILLHIEAQQSSGGANLAERMNHYRCLIYAHHRREPVALAIVTGGKRKKERFYSHSHFGTEIVYRYNNLVLADLEDEELIASNNLIDLALYAAKCALRSKKELQKYKYLRTLTEQLAERGWDRNEKRDLMLFIYRIINLKDETLQQQYWEYRQRMDKEGKLMYEPFLKKVEEKMAEQRGMEKGMEKMAREMAKRLLAKGVSPDIIAQSADIPVEQVHALMN